MIASQRPPPTHLTPLDPRRYQLILNQLTTNPVCNGLLARYWRNVSWLPTTISLQVVQTLVANRPRDYRCQGISVQYTSGLRFVLSLFYPITGLTTNRMEPLLFHSKWFSRCSHSLHYMNSRFPSPSLTQMGFPLKCTCRQLVNGKLLSTPNGRLR